MTLQEQANILAAALAGKALERCPRAFPNEWRDSPYTPDTRLNFQDHIYRVKVPSPRILHQYIIRMTSGDYKTTISFHANADEVYQKCGYRNAKPAPWTRIEVPE